MQSYTEGSKSNAPRCAAGARSHSRHPRIRVKCCAHLPRARNKGCYFWTPLDTDVAKRRHPLVRASLAKHARIPHNAAVLRKSRANLALITRITQILCQSANSPQMIHNCPVWPCRMHELARISEGRLRNKSNLFSPKKRHRVLCVPKYVLCTRSLPTFYNFFGKSLGRF
jgi:hypothetical protein